jgi:hypothetical protein
VKRATKIVIALGTALSLGLGAAAVSAQPFGYGTGPRMMSAYGAGYGMGPRAMFNAYSANADKGTAAGFHIQLRAVGSVANLRR